MKLTHKLCGATLLAATGVALAMPNTTKANDLDGSGHIEFTYNTDEDPIITDPGNSTGTTITTGITTTNPGPMGIIGISPLDFDSHDILTSQTQRDYKALLITANPDSTEEDKATNTGKFDMQNAVWFQDLRATDSRPYQLTAKISENFKEKTSGTYLKGANITYKNINVTSTADPSLKPVEKSGTVKLIAGDGATAGGSEIFVDNRDAAEGVGYGKFELNFGLHSDGTAEEAVMLNIPSTTAIGEGDYSAKITWTMADVI
ncbi:hypothetical protein IGJ02_000525 [Enterococcus sp. DIV0724b]|uniref:WxL domain-containing protein n=1 Tax=Enterococcus sp. DIV0724b TaxID=2774694 RepID=UPI003D2FE6F1